MFLLFHRANSQIAVNVSTTTVTTTAEAGQLPLSRTVSSNSERTMRAPPSTLARDTENARVDKVATPDMKQEYDAEAAYPSFPTHPFRNPRHARHTSIANTPRLIQLFALQSDP